MITDSPLTIVSSSVSSSASSAVERFNELFSVLEDLLKRIADTENPEIRQKRAQVRAELIEMQGNVSKLIPLASE
jgi:hypothetical protein